MQGTQINEAACDLAREIANESDALVAAGVSQTPVYLVNRNQAEVKAIIQKQLDVFIRKDIDFYMVEVTAEHQTPQSHRWAHDEMYP